MSVRTVTEIGLLIRQARRQAGWTQSDLAECLQTTQSWVSEIENGKATAAVGMVLKALAALGLTLTITPAGRGITPPPASAAAAAVPLEMVLQRTRRSEP